MSTQTSHRDTYLPSPTLPIALRTLRPGDGAAFAGLLSDPNNGDNPNPQGETMDAAWGEATIGRKRESASQPTVVEDGVVVSGPGLVNLVIVEGEEGKVVGLGGFGAIKDWERDGKKIRAGDAGVLLDGAVRGKGYGVEAMRLAMDWAVAPASDGGLQLDLLTITTLSDNEAMIRLAEDKLGLRGSGILRPAAFDEEKQELYFEIPAEEWKRRAVQP